MKNELVLVSKKPKTTIKFYFLLSIPIIISFLIYVLLMNFDWFPIKDYFYIATVCSLAFYIYLFFKEVYRRKYRFKLVVDDEYICLYEIKLEKPKLLKKYKIEDLHSIFYDKKHLEKVIIKKRKESKISYVSRPSYVLKFEVEQNEFETIYLSKLLFDKDMIKILIDFSKQQKQNVKIKI